MPPGDSLQDAREEVLLLLQLDALSAQRVHHPVVDLNQPIDVGLLDLANARHEVAVFEQLRALADELERFEEAARERQARQNDSASTASTARR